MARVICPFRPGDRVVYRPSDSGYRYEVSRPAQRHLEPGTCYEVAAIKDGEWLLLRGFEDRTDGGWFWSEFHAIDMTGTAPPPRLATPPVDP